MANSTVKNIRYGCGEGGFACGPVGGDTRVEVMFHDADGKSFFVNASVYEWDVHIAVSPVSIFDIFTYWPSGDDSEFDKAKSYCTTFHEYMTDECDHEVGYGEDFGDLCKEVNFTVNALVRYFSEQDDAVYAKYVNSCLGREVEELDCSYLSFYEEDEDEEEDEE